MSRTDFASSLTGHLASWIGFRIAPGFRESHSDSAGEETPLFPFAGRRDTAACAQRRAGTGSRSALFPSQASISLQTKFILLTNFRLYTKFSRMGHSLSISDFGRSKHADPRH